MKRMKTTFACFALGVLTVLAFLFSCADQSSMLASPGARLVSGADYAGRETCALCHAEISKEFGQTLHARMHMSDPERQERDLVCEACHGPGSLHVEAGGGRDVSIVDPSDNPLACFQCHSSVQARFMQKFKHPLPQGRVGCMDCHDPHGRNIFSPVDRIMSSRDEVCRQCHQEQSGPYVFEHEALREGCTSCHNPHGSINEKLLVQRDTNLCLRCHAQIASPGSVLIGGFSHTSRVAQGACWSSGCHTAVHGSNINSHLRY